MSPSPNPRGKQGLLARHCLRSKYQTKGKENTGNLAKSPGQLLCAPFDHLWDHLRKKDHFYIQEPLWNRVQTLKGYRKLFHRHGTSSRKGETTVPFEKTSQHKKGHSQHWRLVKYGEDFPQPERGPPKPLQTHNLQRLTNQALCKLDWAEHPANSPQPREQNLCPIKVVMAVLLPYFFREMKTQRGLVRW